MQSRAEHHGDALLFRYLLEGTIDGALDEWSFARLDRRARAVAAWLQDRGYGGQRALVVFPHGLEFIEAFFGCLYAGVTPIPAYPPDPSHLDYTVVRLDRIACDAEAALILSVDSLVEQAEKLRLVENAGFVGSLPWVSVEQISSARAKDWRDPNAKPEDLAFLQYTSGSTSFPRGVMLSHGNVTHNLHKLRLQMGHDPEHLAERDGEFIFSWLPLFHDLGLIGVLLHALYVAGTGTFMSPLVFLKQPFLWLRATSRLRAYTAGGPNFCFDMAVRKVSEAQRAELDLSHLVNAFSGAEPVRWKTFCRFADYFAPCGFRPEAFFHAYGLAETCVFLSGGHSKLDEPT
ncbi:MAG: AMP-binding protein, partial [Proteobacteria bacterium]|nr:AMP-binding protein [Pseudomonadota bacterium]